MLAFRSTFAGSHQEEHIWHAGCKPLEAGVPASLSAVVLLSHDVFADMRQQCNRLRPANLCTVLSQASMATLLHLTEAAHVRGINTLLHTQLCLPVLMFTAMCMMSCRCTPPLDAGVMLQGGREVAADLVVDCSGRCSCMAQWLSANGLATPRVSEVNASLGYASW